MYFYYKTEETEFSSSVTQVNRNIHKKRKEKKKKIKVKKRKRKNKEIRKEKEKKTKEKKENVSLQVTYLDGVILVKSSPIVLMTRRPQIHNPREIPHPP